MFFKRSLITRSMLACALAAAAALMSAPAAHAADPPKASASTTASPQSSLVAADADVGHTSTLAVVIGVLIVAGVAFLIIKKGREPKTYSPGGGGGGSTSPTRPPTR